MNVRPNPRTRLAAALAGGLFLGLLLAACTGDDSTTQAPASTAQTEMQAAGAETAPAPTATAPADAALPLNRYHYVAALTIEPKDNEDGENRIVISTEGDFQSPDRHAFTYTISRGDGAVSQQLVIIGKRAWHRQGENAWRETTGDDPEVTDLMATAFSPARSGFLYGEAYSEVKESVFRLPATPEPVNDVPAHHYRPTSAGQEFFRTFLADEQLLRQVRDLQWDLWLAEDGGWPVRMRTAGTVTAGLRVLEELEVPVPADWTLQIDISRPNDPLLAVRAPDPEP